MSEILEHRLTIIKEYNDRRSKGHSNKDIDPTRTHLNFYCKKNELTYIILIKYVVEIFGKVEIAIEIYKMPFTNI